MFLDERPNPDRIAHTLLSFETERERGEHDGRDPAEFEMLHDFERRAGTRSASETRHNHGQAYTREMLVHVGDRILGRETRLHDISARSGSGESVPAEKHEVSAVASGRRIGVHENRTDREVQGRDDFAYSLGGGAAYSHKQYVGRIAHLKNLLKNPPMAGLRS